MHLNSFPGDNKENLKPFYDNAARQSPQVYQKYTYEQWLEFLHEIGYILDLENSKLGITILGRDFLKFLIETGKSEFRPN